MDVENFKSTLFTLATITYYELLLEINNDIINTLLIKLNTFSYCLRRVIELHFFPKIKRKKMNKISPTIVNRTCVKLKSHYYKHTCNSTK